MSDEPRKQRIRIKPEFQKSFVELQESFVMTSGDIEAFVLLCKAGEIGLDNYNRYSKTMAGDRIIALAEKIKAQRLTVAMKNNVER